MADAEQPKECWGCAGPLPEGSGDYCPVCEASLKLIRLLEEHGCRPVLWTIPEQQVVRED